MIKLVVIFKMKLSNVIGLLLLVFALAACSQKNAMTNDAVDVTVGQADADSLVDVNQTPKLADAIAVDSVKIDSFVAEDVIVKDSVDEEGGVRYRRLKFKINSHLYQRFKDVDSIACSFNNWNYVPDAVYEVNVKEFIHEGGGEEDEVVYRNGIKVMESREEGGGDGVYYSKTYYYSDGSVADFEESKIDSGKEVYFETPNILRVIVLVDDKYFSVHLRKDTLSIGEIEEFFSDSDEVKVINEEVYLVVDEGSPVPEFVEKVIKSIERYYYCKKFDKIKFLKKTER